MQNIDLLYTDEINFNGNNVEALYLNDSKIWGEPKTYNFSVNMYQIVNITFASPTTYNQYQTQCSTQIAPLRTDKPVAVGFIVDNKDVVIGIGETITSDLFTIVLDEVRLSSDSINTFDLIFRGRRHTIVGTTKVHPKELYFKYPEV